MEATRRIEVTSPDGVHIVGEATGEGPGLLLVYGAMMEQHAWARLIAQLPGRTIYTYDRRGRGESTSRPGYEVQWEVDDLLAFASALAQPLDAFGHSSGALLVLHAALRGMPVRRMALYEPPLAGIREPQLPAELPRHLLDLVEQGNRDEALAQFYKHGMWLTDDDVARLRLGPRWADQMRYAETGAYDVTITRTFPFDPVALSKLTMPSLFLYGDQSPEWMQEGVATFAKALPDSQLEVLAGQGHNAQFADPALLGGRVSRFLAERA
jgi:pimeloyl-ACP methyl ester carboxylesterase